MSEIGKAICKIVGIDPKRCKSLILRLEPEKTTVMAELTLLPLTIINEVEVAMTIRQWEIKEIMEGT